MKWIRHEIDNIVNDATNIRHVLEVTSSIELIQITKFPLNTDNLLINRQASRLIAFGCQVYANLSIEETATRQSAEKTSGDLVYKFDELFICHWDDRSTSSSICCFNRSICGGYIQV
jgi:hypothetical protein